MNSLRVLLVHSDPTELDRITTLLEEVQHAVLPTEGLGEALEALELQRFDAVLLPNDLSDSDLAPFAAKLREIEKSQRVPSRVAILSCSQEVSQAGIRINESTEGSYIDAYLPEPFEAATFSRAVECLAERVCGSFSQAEDTEELPAFEAEAFREHLGGDQDLVVEILGLFLEEYVSQLSEMEDSLRNGSFESLSRVAHTLKGSLGTLHANRARSRSHDLEIAARKEERQSCERLLALLREDLEELQPQLTIMRDAG